MNSLAKDNSQPKQSRYDVKQRRKQAMRTAWILATIAALIFTAFILSGVMGG